MKKALFIAIFLFSAPTFTFASSVQDQYISALQQLITLLTQQVNSLIIQLGQVQLQTPNPDIIVPSTVPLPTFSAGNVAVPDKPIDNTVPINNTIGTVNKIDSQPNLPALQMTVHNAGGCGDSTSYFHPENLDKPQYYAVPNYVVYVYVPLNTPVTFSSDDTGYFNVYSPTGKNLGISTTTVTFVSQQMGNNGIFSFASYCSLKTSGITFTASAPNYATSTTSI